MVNLHAALLSTAVALRVGMSISMQVFLTDKGSEARVVWIDSPSSLRCGPELVSRKTSRAWAFHPTTGLSLSRSGNTLKEPVAGVRKIQKCGVQPPCLAYGTTTRSAARATLTSTGVRQTCSPSAYTSIACSVSTNTRPAP